MTADLAIVIPASNPNGIFINKTIEDLVKNIRANTEIIVVYNGARPDPAIPQHELLTVVYYADKIGQRAATNQGAKLTKAKYIMKMDAHCAVDEGFDQKMLDAFKITGDNVTIAPIMRNLWAFDWKCLKCGKKWYQGPTPTKCLELNYKNTGTPCDSTQFERKIMWIGKNNPQSTSFCFDATPHFQYFEDWKHRPQYENDKREKGLTESMSLQGSCWMLTREKYWELNISDEAFGSWGSQGIEVAAKTWLSGGQVLINHKTWYAHMFRTQGGDFSFSHKITAKEVSNARNMAKDLFFNNKWDKQVRPLSWLVEKFWPVKGWTEEDLANLKKNTFKFSEEIEKNENDEIEPTESLVSSGVIYQANQ